MQAVGVELFKVDPLDPVVESEITVKGVTVFKVVDVVEDVGNEYPNVGFVWDWLYSLKKLNNWFNPASIPTPVVLGNCACWEIGITWGISTWAGIGAGVDRLCWIFWLDSS